MKFNSIIFIFLILVSCGQFNIQDSCDCDSEKLALEEAEAKIIELKKLTSPSKQILEYSFLAKTNWQEIEDKLQKDKLSEAWPAWLHGCEKLIELDNWKSTCHASKNLSTPSNTEIISFLHKYFDVYKACLLYTSPSPRDATLSRMPSSA